MVSVMGRRGVTAEQLVANVITMNDTSVDSIIRKQSSIKGQGLTSLVTASYVEDAINNTVVKSSVFSQNYVSPTYETTSSDPHRWIISGGLRTGINNDLQITVGGAAVLRVPAGRLPVDGEYVLGLKGYISPTATVTIAVGNNNIATFAGGAKFSEINMSVIMNITNVNTDITIRIENGLNSYLYGPVYLCSSSALLSYYINAHIHELLSAGDAVTLPDLVEYVRTNAIPLSNQRYLVDGNKAIPTKTMIIRNNDGGHVELPIYLQTKNISDSHGPNSPIGQMGQFVFPDDETVLPLFSPQRLSPSIINYGFGYKFHSTTHVKFLYITLSIGGEYKITTTANNGTLSTNLVTILSDSLTTIPIDVDVDIISIKNTSATTEDVVVSMDIETDVLSKCAICSGVRIQAVDMVSVSAAEIDVLSVPHGIWYPLIANANGDPSVLTVPFVIASYHTNAINGSAAALEWVTRSRTSAHLLQYASSYIDSGVKTITLHKLSSVVGASVSLPVVGDYTVTITVDEVVHTKVISCVIPHIPVVIPLSVTGLSFVFSITDDTGELVSDYQPNVYLEAIWYDDMANTWSDGVDRVILGYIRVSDHIQFYPRGGNTVQGGRIFSGLESAIVPDPDTGICSLYWNPNLNTSILHK